MFCSMSFFSNQIQIHQFEKKSRKCLTKSLVDNAEITTIDTDHELYRRDS